MKIIKNSQEINHLLNIIRDIKVILRHIEESNLDFNIEMYALTNFSFELYKFIFQSFNESKSVYEKMQKLFPIESFIVKKYAIDKRINFDDILNAYKYFGDFHQVRFIDSFNEEKLKYIKEITDKENV